MENEISGLMRGDVVGDTPEDVAVLYSWANLQGAKYRDFSAARREYRAAMRHRAAEDQRFAEAAAQAEAEQAAAEAERAAREAEEAARFHEVAARRAATSQHPADRNAEEEARSRALRHAEDMSRIAAAERMEAARRAEGVAAAEAASRRESREMQEARASAERQAARYAESEHRRRDRRGPQPIALVPGQITDPYAGNQQSMPGRIFHQPSVPDEDMLPTRHIPTGQRLIIPRPESQDVRRNVPAEYADDDGTFAHDAEIAALGPAAIAEAARGAHPAFRQVFSEPQDVESRAAAEPHARPTREIVRERTYRIPAPQPAHHSSSRDIPIARDSDIAPVADSETVRPVHFSLPPSAMQADDLDRPLPTGTTLGLENVKPIQFERSTEHKPHRTNGLLGLDLDIEPDETAAPAPIRRQQPIERPASVEVPVPVSMQPPAMAFTAQAAPTPRRQIPQPLPPLAVSSPDVETFVPVFLPAASAESASEPALRPHSAVPNLEPSAQQRAYSAAKAEAAAKAAQAQAQLAASRNIRGYAPDEASGFFAAYGSARAQQVAIPLATPGPAPQEGPVPAWLNAPSAKLDPIPAAETTARRKSSAVSSASIPTAAPDTLQKSRERVAARWYALKGVFDHGIQEIEAERAQRGDEEKKAPIVAIFSLAGGTGKTSMVATLGRTLSSTGEKVLLTDTTSHGLLPFYFGASELRPGVMRTFSPPSGSADAAICLLSYDVLQRSGDQASQDWFAEEIHSKSQGMARVILDLSSATPWVARRLARMDATMLVPLAADMNSVISLGAMEKFFAGMKDSSGKPVQPFYVMNLFDSALALHLDVREVLRQQLGDRLLPFSIRRAAAVPESLAEGMTVIDYAQDSPVAEDYRNLATWLKLRAAPALSANQTTRWSER